MDKGVGVGLAAVGAEVFALAGSAAFATPLCVPGVVTPLVQQVALHIAEGGADAVLAIGLLGAVECAAAHLGREVGAGDAEDLPRHDMVDALLQVGYLLHQPCQQPLGHLPQKDATLAARVEEPRLRTAEQLLRQQVKHTVGQLRRSEHLIAAQIGQAVQYVW